MPLTLAEKLKLLRARKKLTQEQAAQEWGINKNTLVAYETGNRNPSKFVLKHLEEIIKRDLPDL